VIWLRDARLAGASQRIATKAIARFHVSRFTHQPIPQQHPVTVLLSSRTLTGVLTPFRLARKIARKGMSLTVEFMAEQQMQTIFCERFNCAPSDYQEMALNKCFYLRARFLAPLIRRLMPKLFTEDLKFIMTLGTASDAWEAHKFVLAFHDTNRWNREFLRKRLKIRVSGRKAIELAHELFAKVDPMKPSCASQHLVTSIR
jgi:hypothetical protein